MSYARETGFAIQQASENQEVRDALCHKLGISKQELAKLFAGRLFLTGADLDTVAEICGASARDLVNPDPTLYDARVVDCMTPFSCRENREMVLDLINAYIDAKEALASVEQA